MQTQGNQTRLWVKMKKNDYDETRASNVPSIRTTFSNYSCEWMVNRTG